MWSTIICINTISHHHHNSVDFSRLERRSFFDFHEDGGKKSGTFLSYTS